MPVSHTLLNPSNVEIRPPRTPSGAKGKTIRYSLRTTSLDAHPTFEALLFVWGDALIMQSINVDGSCSPPVSRSSSNQKCMVDDPSTPKPQAPPRGRASPCNVYPNSWCCLYSHYLFFLGYYTCRTSFCSQRSLSAFLQRSARPRWDVTGWVNPPRACEVLPQ
jgi:hypothetical protein